jgi:nucleoid-associated protein YgaU
VSTVELLCPVCQTPQLPSSSVCPGCGEDLAALLHLQARQKLLYNAALRLAKQGQTEMAIASLVQANEIALADPTIMVVLGKLYAQQGRYDNARSSWIKALELRPGIAEAEAGLRRLDAMAQEATTAKASREKEQAAALKRNRQVNQRRSLMTLVGAFVAGAIVLFLFQLVWPQSSAAQSTSRSVALVPSSPTVTPSATPTATPTATVVPSATSAPTAVPSATSAPTVAPPTLVPTPTVPDYAQAVQLAIKARPELAKYTIDVKQDGLVVRLSGLVPTLLIRYQVEYTARGVQGVTLLDLGELRLMGTYTVQLGDSPWSIADKVYGDGRLYPALLRANNLDITAPFYPGLELVLPSPMELK